ncbi:MAG: VTT domain-containing protein [Clostridia bacterium]|nr:VTT domain-containing protein [Clostridia bacterium]
MAKNSTNKWKIWASVLFVLIFFCLVVFLFSGDNFGVLKEIFNINSTKEQVQQSIGKLGIRAYIVICIMAMIQVIFTFVPAEPLHVVSGISFGLWKGLLVCLIGILLGNTIIYILNKLYGAKLKHFFETNIDFDFNRAKASKKIALIVIILYCLPAIPYGIICFFAASMNMRYDKYILITGIGSIPSLLLDVGLGHITMSTSWLVSIIVFVAIIVLLILMWKFKKQIFDKINLYIKRSQEKEKNKVGNYNPFVFNCVGLGLYGAIKTKVKIKLKNNVGKLDKPCIVLCNHGSFYDFAYAGKLLRKEKPHFIVARMYFHHKLLGRIISATGAFPKSMFTNDVENLRNSLKVLSSNGVLAMMPEARLSTVGQFEGIQDTTYKFIQKMDVAVYTIKINGSYLAKPKWADKIRKGAHVNAELNQLFKAGQTKTLDIKEIKQKVDEALYYDEWKWLDNNPDIIYKHKDIAKGLENILCVCPKCKQKHSFTTNKNIITCQNCNLTVQVDNRYQLQGVEFKNIAEWYAWQTNEIKKEIQHNPNFSLTSEVELRHLSTDGKSCTRHAGNGVCTFDKNGLKYVGTQDGKDIEKIFTLDSIYRVLFGAGEDFEIYEEKELYYFVPTDKRSAVMWYIVSGLFKK